MSNKPVLRSIPNDLLYILIHHSGKDDITEKKSLTVYLLEKGTPLIKRFLEYQLMSQKTIAEIFETACLSRNYEVAKLLFWKAKKSHKPIFEQACYNGDLCIIKFIWENGAKVNLSDGLKHVCCSDDNMEWENCQAVIDYLWHEGAELVNNNINIIDYVAFHRNYVYKKDWRKSKILNHLFSLGGSADMILFENKKDT